jgi:hypothetical protein
VLYDPNDSTLPEPDINMETLRERHASKQSGWGNDPDIIRIVKRTPLPRYSFLNQIFKPFGYAALWGRFIVVSLLCVTGLFIGTQLPAIFGISMLLMVLSVPLGVIISILGLGLLANTAHNLFLWTTTGNDVPEKEEWMEFRLLDSWIFSVWLVLLTILAATPGYLLLSHAIVFPEWTLSGLSIRLAFVTVLLLFGSVILFFPVLFLSSMESGSYFVVLSKETCRSLINNTGIWLRFYFVSVLLFIFVCATILVISFVIHHIFIGIFLLIPIGVFFSLLYARLLGQLGWILAESVRQTTTEDYR